jgi:hypothetical protein
MVGQERIFTQSVMMLDPQEPWSNVETMSLAAILIRTGNDINVYPGYQLACRVGRKIRRFLWSFTSWLDEKRFYLIITIIYSFKKR